MFSEIYITFIEWGMLIKTSAPLLIYSSTVLIIWFIISIISYKAVWSILDSKSLQDFIDRFVWSWTWYHKLTKILKKGISWSIFLVFIRWSVRILELDDLDKFMTSLLHYIPSLFIALIIWFFWIRFASTVYNIVYQAVKFENENTAKVLANVWRIIILIFTFTIVVRNIKLVSDETFYVLLVWLVFMISLAWWIAFWLWWREFAKDILNEFRIKPKIKKSKKTKNTKI